MIIAETMEAIKTYREAMGDMPERILVSEKMYDLMKEEAQTMMRVRDEDEPTLMGIPIAVSSEVAEDTVFLEVKQDETEVRRLVEEEEE